MGPPYEPLTFRDITEVYRREKKTKELTDIRPDFYSAMIDFVERSKRDNEEAMTKDPFSLKALSISDTIKKASAKAVQIWEIRAEKILLAALRASSGAKVDTHRLTKGERALFDEVFSALNATRYDLLSERRTISSKEVEGETDEEEVVAEEELEANVETVSMEVMTEKQEPIKTSAAEERPTERLESRERIIVRILEDVAPFAGPDRNYDLRREDIVTLPPIIGRALVDRGMAVEIKPEKI